MRTDRQTDGERHKYNEAKSGNFANAPRNKPVPVPLFPPQIPNGLAGVDCGPPR